MVHTFKDRIEHKVHIQHSVQKQINQRGTTQLLGRFFKSGLESFEDYEIIELLFSFALSEKEYKKQAKKCMEQFGTLRGIVDASHEELQQGGIAPLAILYIRLISEIPVRVLKQKIIGKPVFRSSQEVFDYLYYSLRGLKNEVFKVIYLNNRNQIIEILDLFTGTLKNILVCPRSIIENASRYGAASMIFAHNHPSGDPTPSKNDKQITRDLVFIGSIIQVKVLDHIIIGDNEHFSFQGEGLIEKYEDDLLTLRLKVGT